MPLLQELKTARSDLRLVQIQIIARPFIWYGVSYFGFIVSLINSLLSGKVCELSMSKFSLLTNSTSSCCALPGGESNCNYCTALCCTVLYRAVLCCTVLCCTVLYCTICTVLYRTVL